MRTAWIWLALALLFVPGVPAAPMPGAPGPAPVRADFSDAVAAAEAGWREDVCGALRAYASRLLDAERAATREEDLDAANRIRDLRRSVERLVSEVAAFESLVGLVPVPGGNAVEGAARVAHAACRETVDAANGRYAAALKKAASAASAALDIRMGSATDEADLDRANALADAKRNVDREVKLRMTPLVWWDISFPTRTLFAFRGDDYQWRVDGRELVGTRFGNEPHMDTTLARHFSRIASVTVRGRIRSPHTTNFRMSVGPLNMILNWELGPKSIFRWYESGGDVPHRLTPGRFTDITVRQTSPGHSRVLFDGRPVWSTENGLFGAVTIYTYASAIGVTDIRILGVPDPERKVKGPTARLW